MMMQRTANEYAAFERRICKRSDQPKINRITNNDARLILRKRIVPEILLKSEESVKYANEITDDVIHSTQYYIMYTNSATLANLQRR